MNLEFDISTEALAASDQRALGSLISKYKKLTDMGFDTYTKCFKASICPVIDYGAEVCGYTKCPKLDNV